MRKRSLKNIPHGQVSSGLDELSPNVNEYEVQEHYLVDVRSISLNINASYLWCLLGMAALYIVVPMVLRYSYIVQSMVIYVNFIPIPFTGNLSHPSDFGLRGTRHECIWEDGYDRMCFWHILPIQYSNLTTSPDQFSTYLSDGLPIFIYAHGNTGSRAVYHRVKLYKLLARKGFHVIAFDYHGFGDSGGDVSEFGLTEDLLLMWNWTTARAPKSNIILFGHSLGCAPTAQAASLLGNHSSLAGVVLDAPYTTIQEAAFHHPFGIPYWPIMSLLIKSFVFVHFQEKFPVIEHVEGVLCPIMIFHGRKDMIVPYHLGYNVFLNAQKHSQSGMVDFYDCGNTTHKKNYLSPVFSDALDKFVSSNDLL